MQKSTNASQLEGSNKLPVIGNSTRITVKGIAEIPAKVDTGAARSSIWASNIRLTPDNQLEFSLFDHKSPLYTGERILVSQFEVVTVRNSTGQEGVRYVVTLPTTIEGKKIRISYTLADRGRNKFPVLIGCRTLKGKFLVDVSEQSIKPAISATKKLNRELKTNPQKFHQKYMESK